MQILIAGAGIGGLAAALALARIGARVIVVERAPELVAVGAGLQLSPNATRILRGLGVLDAVSSHAAKPAGIRVRSARNGQTLSYLPLDGAEARWGAPYLVARRADLQHVLAAAVEAEPGVTLHLGTALAGFGTTADGVQATLRHGLIARTMAADALIGADGIRSAVRARLHGGTLDAPQETGRTAWRAMVEAAALPSPLPAGETGLWLGRDAHLVHYPLDGGRLHNVVAVTRDTTRADAEAIWSSPGEAGTINARFAGWNTAARALIAAAPAWTTWSLQDRAPLAAWNAGPVALMGDAAHPILPFLAQGAAQAIEDAAALAQAFATLPSPAEALASYCVARLARAARVQATSRRLGRVYHLAGPAGAARDATMRLLGGGRLLAGYDWLYGA